MSIPAPTKVSSPPALGLSGLNQNMASDGVTKGGTSSGGNFSDLVKGIATEALETNKAADQASIAAAKGDISDYNLVQVMTEADDALQRFKTTYETIKESVDKTLNMNI